MNNKHLFIGLAFSLLLSALGTFLYMYVFFGSDIKNIIAILMQSKQLGKVIALGSVPNILLFAYFMKKNNLKLAQGVILAVFLITILTIFV